MKDVLRMIICPVICLFILSGTARTDTCGIPGDANRDGKVGLEDAVYALQVTAGVAELPIDQKNVMKNALKSAYTAAQLYFTAEYPNAAEITMENIQDYGYVPVEGVEIHFRDARQDTLAMWANMEGGGICSIDRNGYITITDDYNFSAEIDAKKAYTASQSFFKEYPDTSLDIRTLVDSGFSSSDGVVVTINSGDQSKLLITTKHVLGDTFYSVDSTGSVTSSTPR